MARELYQPHDNLFRKVFSNAPEAAGLLRPNLPAWLSTRLDWSTLTLQDRSYVDEELEASQSDLLFEVQWQAGDGQAGAGQAGAGAAGSEPQRLLLYVLFEHQSTPNRWMRFRLLEYCCRIWADALRADNKRAKLPPIVPVVFYQGKRRWRHAREFAELFAEAVREWPWTPRFEHLLVDQSQAAVGDVRGGALGRVAQLALMAAARRRVSQVRAALLMAAQYMGELAGSGRIEPFRAIVRYVITTQDKRTVREFGEALRRHVPGPGGDMKTYAEELLQEGLQEGLQKGLQKGRREGQLGTIENFLRAGIEWSVIKEATGIDQEAFQALRQRIEESNGTTE
jgi:predicted transposase YdaD